MMMSAERSIANLIQSRHAQLRDVCRARHVRRPVIFGSGATERFDPSTSDLDLLVEFERAHVEKDTANLVLKDWTTSPTWAIELDGRVVGAIDLWIKAEHRRAELAYRLARRHWGHGLTTEAARAVVDAAFETWPELNRIHANADARNPASVRVMEKVGMQHEGTLRKHYISRGEEPHDSVECGLLREDWEQARKPGWAPRPPTESRAPRFDRPAQSGALLCRDARDAPTRDSAAALW